MSRPPGRISIRAGAPELREGYDDASESYDDYWLTIAAAPIDEMFARFPEAPNGRALDCGCGTGCATSKLLARTAPHGSVLAVDLSPGMIDRARARLLEAGGRERVTFRVGDVLAELARAQTSYDAAAMTWLIVYVSCEESFPLVRGALKEGGHFGFVAHLSRSRVVPIEEFEALAREEPAAFQRYVEFCFPADIAEVRRHLASAQLAPVVLEAASSDFVCKAGQGVYEHLMKSGARATYWLALKPQERERFTRAFVERIERRFEGREAIVIEHRYVLGIARAT